MKKILLVIVSMVIAAVASNELNATVKAFSTYTEVIPAESTRVVSVQMIKRSGNLWVKSSKSGLYDSERNTIKIGDEIYNVSDNSYSGGGRENYSYQAGGIYFFNL